MNEQKPMPKDTLQDDKLAVKKIWYTIQGEGPFAGRPAVFVRLAGCNLQCPLCDTDYTGGDRGTPEEIVAVIKDVFDTHRADIYNTPVWGMKHPSLLVVITGGEPFRQDIVRLLALLSSHEIRVQIETNGSYLPPPILRHFGLLSIVCSPKVPKLPQGFGETVRITAFKYVIRQGEINLEDGLPTKTLGYNYPPARPPSYWEGNIYLQPCDEGQQYVQANEGNLKAALESSLKFGYVMGVQMHKILGVE